MQNTHLIEEYNKLIEQIKQNVSSFDQTIYPVILQIEILDSTRLRVRVADFYLDNIFFFIVDAETLEVVRKNTS